MPFGASGAFQTPGAFGGASGGASGASGGPTAPLGSARHGSAASLFPRLRLRLLQGPHGTLQRQRASLAAALPAAVPGLSCCGPGASLVQRLRLRRFQVPRSTLQLQRSSLPAVLPAAVPWSAPLCSAAILFLRQWRQLRAPVAPPAAPSGTALQRAPCCGRGGGRGGGRGSGGCAYSPFRPSAARCFGCQALQGLGRCPPRRLPLRRWRRLPLRLLWAAHRTAQPVHGYLCLVHVCTASYGVSTGVISASRDRDHRSL